MILNKENIIYLIQLDYNNMNKHVSLVQFMFLTSFFILILHRKISIDFIILFYLKKYLIFNPTLETNQDKLYKLVTGGIYVI